MGGDELGQRPGRVLQARVGLQVRQGAGAALGFWVLPAAECQTPMRLQAAMQLGGRQEQLRRFQDGALQIVAQAFLSAFHFRPEALRSGGQIPPMDDERVCRQIVEQGGEPVEEQGQVALDAVRGDAGGNILIDAAAAHIYLEGLMPAVAEGANARLVEGKFPGRQQADAMYPLQGHLRVRGEDAQGFDFLVQQIHPDGMGSAHGEDIDERAAHRELAPVAHGFRCQIAGGFQPGAFRAHVEAVPFGEAERMAIDEGQGRRPLHQGGNRGDQNAAGQWPRLARRAGQPAQGRQPFGNDVRVRRKRIVGQSFPVRKSADGRIVAGEERRLFRPAAAIRRVVGDDQRQPAMRRRRLHRQLPGGGIEQIVPDKRRSRLRRQRDFPDRANGRHDGLCLRSG